jgi:hypothetical protein
MFKQLKTMVDRWLSKYGRVQKNPEVDQVFSSFQVKEELDYFYTGSEVDPLAILGLLPQYPLNSEFWESIELTPAKLAKWIQWMNSGNVASLPPCGWRIYNRADEVIGIIYAREKVVVTFERDGSVCVYPPDDPMKDRS